MYDEELTATENAARALCSIADSLRGVGMGGNDYPGALENVSILLCDLTTAVHAVAEAISEDKGQA